MCVSPGKTWYLPHHNVVNVNKPAKTRTVFDCAAEFAGTSLNKEGHSCSGESSECEEP